MKRKKEEEEITEDQESTQLVDLLDLNVGILQVSNILHHCKFNLVLDICTLNS